LKKKNGIQQNLYAMPFGTLRIAKPLAGSTNRVPGAKYLVGYRAYCSVELSARHFVLPVSVFMPRDAFPFFSGFSM
jgi:hypothetical protein